MTSITREVAGTAAPARRARRRSRLQLTNYVYLLPALVIVLGVTGFCVGFVVNTSFYRWTGVGPGAVWVGMQNFAQFIGDPVVYLSLLHIGLICLTIPISLFLGLLAATILHSGVRAGAVFKALLFMPVVVSPALTAPTLRQIFAPDGYLNYVLKFIGLNGGRAWLSTPGTALLALALIVIWASAGFAYLLYYAQIATIDREVLEAARVDGANNARIFISFLVPLCRPATATLLLLSLISLSKFFDYPFLLTAGGPLHGTEFLGTYLYTQLTQYFDAGYAATLSVAVMLLCVAFSVVQRVMSSRGVS